MDQDVKVKTAWVWEFSKRLVLMLSAAYFAVIIYAAVAMSATGNMDALGELVDCNADVLKVCVFGYFIKAGVENALKIKQGSPEDIPEPDMPSEPDELEGCEEEYDDDEEGDDEDE